MLKRVPVVFSGVVQTHGGGGLDGHRVSRTPDSETAAAVLLEKIEPFHGWPWKNTSVCGRCRVAVEATDRPPDPSHLRNLRGSAPQTPQISMVRISTSNPGGKDNSAPTQHLHNENLSLVALGQKMDFGLVDPSEANANLIHQ